MEDIVAHRVAALTDSQRRMLRLASGGATVAEIAVRLGLPPRVVARELSAVLTALGVGDTRQATILWWGSRVGASPHMVDAAQDLVS
jgi:DNA-binding NarL/FixJ family response regulator